MLPQSTGKTRIDVEFRPRLEPKKHAKQFEDKRPFPNCAPNQKIVGIFTGLSVEIIENQGIAEIHLNGNYGKGSLSRNTPALLRSKCENQNETLVLQLEEAFFLAYFLEVLLIQDLKMSTLDWQQFLKIAENMDSNFIDSFAAYLYLKSKGWIIKSGLKFGGNFTIYKSGPESYHSSFVVFVINSKESEVLVHKNLKGLQRIAETSNKDVLILETIKPNAFEFRMLTDIQKISISETIVRRLKLSSFVQFPSINK